MDKSNKQWKVLNTGCLEKTVRRKILIYSAFEVLNFFVSSFVFIFPLDSSISWF